MAPAHVFKTQTIIIIIIYNIIVINPRGKLFAYLEQLSIKEMKRIPVITRYAVIIFEVCL